MYYIIYEDKQQRLDKDFVVFRRISVKETAKVANYTVDRVNAKEDCVTIVPAAEQNPRVLADLCPFPWPLPSPSIFPRSRRFPRY